MKMKIVAAILIVIMSSPALGHDYLRPELAPWFMGLHSRSGSPCCDGADATHLADVEWRTIEGHYQVFLKGDWRVVPDTAIVDGPNREGTALVWTYFQDGEQIGVRCFMPGAGT